ncbi:MAG: GNAT family N-acetyltransferase [Pseudomonadota bacterium]
MLTYLRKLLRPSGRFDPSVARSPVAAVQLRGYSKSDLDACLAIYSANYSDLPIAKYRDEFAGALELPSCAWLVAHQGNDVLGVDGIRLEATNTRNASLLFGMVHPSAHGQGIGTALLLSRICCLPRPDAWTKIEMTSAGVSTGFYKQFGFKFKGEGYVEEDGGVIEIYYTIVTAAAWEICQQESQTWLYADEAEALRDRLVHEK